MRYRSILILMLACALPLANVHAATLSSQFSALVAKQKLTLSKQAACVTGPQGIVVSRNANLRIIPASVSKLYTFDWALSTLPTDFRYETDFYVKGSTIYINGGGDPHFVIEHLRDMIKTAHDDEGVMIKKIVFSPNFFFNWKSTPADITTSMELSLAETKQLDPSFPLADSFTVSAADAPYTGSGTKYQFGSMPLPALMKQMSDYSTNISTDTLFAKLGGPTGFAAYMKKTYGVDAKTVHFETGSGLSGNYTTCSLTLRVMKHLQSTAKQKGIPITDIMTVPTVDPGVLDERKLDPSDAKSLVAKSGTVDNHQSLAGIISTAKGPEYFAVFTDFPVAGKLGSIKDMIDAFVSAVLKSQRSTLKPYNYTPDPELFQQYRITRR